MKKGLSVSFYLADNIPDSGGRASAIFYCGVALKSF
jgi:hypothetical protein